MNEPTQNSLSTEKSSNEFLNNQYINNKFNFQIDYLDGVDYNKLKESMSGKFGEWHNDESNTKFSNLDIDFFVCESCDNIVIENSNIKDIYFLNTHNSQVKNVISEKGNNGISLFDSNNNIINIDIQEANRIPVLQKGSSGNTVNLVRDNCIDADSDGYDDCEIGSYSDDGKPKDCDDNSRSLNPGDLSCLNNQNCKLNNARFSSSKVNFGADVNLYVDGLNCNSENIGYNIIDRETNEIILVQPKDSLISSSSSTIWNSEIGNCIQDEKDYFFNAYLKDAPSINVDSDFIKVIGKNVDCGDCDLDGICRQFDNCPDTSNSDQRDSDGDGNGDRCSFSCIADMNENNKFDVNDGTQFGFNFGDDGCSLNNNWCNLADIDRNGIVDDDDKDILLSYLLNSNADSCICSLTEEVCDGLDNNCDGLIDEGGDGLCTSGKSCTSTFGCRLATVFCTDNDNDGYFVQGNCGSLVDCNDGDRLINPGRTEICDGKDNNCNGIKDEGRDNLCELGEICSSSGCQLENVFCTDNDNDGYFVQRNCLTLVDCNDGDRLINPGRTEMCDRKDNNCNGIKDEICINQ